MVILLKETAKTAHIGKTAVPGYLKNMQIGARKQTLRYMNAPVMDRLLRHPPEFLLEQTCQSSPVTIQFIGQKIHIQCRIVQIFPDQIKRGFHRIIVDRILAPRKSQQLTEIC